MGPAEIVKAAARPPHSKKIGAHRIVSLRDKTAKSGGEFGDGGEEEVGLGGAEASFRWERAEDGYCADAGAARHL